jgi:sigma-E factor negative regulatory protein RseC
MTLQARNDCAAKVGDQVLVTVEAGVFMSAVGIMYGIPFIAMVGGFLGGLHLAQWLGFGYYAPLAGFLFGIGLTALTFVLIKNKEPERSKKGRVPVASEIVSK